MFGTRIESPSDKSSPTARLVAVGEEKKSKSISVRRAFDHLRGRYPQGAGQAPSLAGVGL